MTEAIVTALAAAENQPGAALQALGQLAEEVSGARLVTLTLIDAEGGAERIYSNMPEAYPVSGTKPMNESYWRDHVIGAHKTFVANDIAAIAEVFPDHPLILSLGCESVVNLPVVVGGKVYGTINCLAGPGHFTPDCVVRVEGLRLAGAATCLLHRLMTQGVAR